MAAVAPQPVERKLRVGVFADARRQPRWVAEAFDRLARSDFAEIVVLVTGAASARAPLLWDLYRRLDGWAFGADGSEPVDLAAALGACAGDAAAELDVAFAVGAVDEAPLLEAARYGVWRFCFGNERAHAESLAGWRELTQGAPLMGAGITVRLAGGGPPRLAYQSWSRTYPLSLARNRVHLFGKSAELPWRALRELHRGGAAWLEQCRPVREGTLEAPTNAEVLRAAAGIGARLARRGLQKALGVEQWSLAWRFGETGLPSPALEGYARTVPPADRDWADPFVVEKHGRYFVFFEELPYAEGKGHIAMMEVRRDGTASAPVRVLERPYHLSYPFLVEEAGELYLIPETATNGTVEAYRCVDFPLSWRLERVLMDGVRLVDATLHRAPERWWLFANAAVSRSTLYDDELHLYYADSFLGPWRAHPANPVKSDPRGARPAGQLFRRGGALHRPAQICVPRYGAGIAVQRVLRLTPGEYVERQAERLLPAGGLLGLHTVNRAGALTVVDVFARRSRFGGAG